MHMCACVCMCVCDVVVMFKNHLGRSQTGTICKGFSLRDGGPAGARSPASHTYFCLWLAYIGLQLSILVLFFFLPKDIYCCPLYERCCVITNGAVLNCSSHCWDYPTSVCAHVKLLIFIQCCLALNGIPRNPTENTSTISPTTFRYPTKPD